MQKKTQANNFPSFCGGLAYILTVPAIRKLVSASLSTKSSDFLWLDDVFITGILALKAKVPLINIEHLYEPRDLGPVPTPTAPIYSRSRSRRQRAKIVDYLIYGPGSRETLNRSLND